MPSFILLSFIFMFLACLIALIIDRHILLKFFMCYEALFFALIITLLIHSVDINNILLIFYLLFLSAFELVIGLSILLIDGMWQLRCRIEGRQALQ